jgi:hypothetical protein
LNCFTVGSSGDLYEGDEQHTAEMLHGAATQKITIYIHIAVITTYLTNVVASNNLSYPMRFDVLMAVKMWMLVFWDVTPCGFVCCFQRFGKNAVLFYRAEDGLVS